MATVTQGKGLGPDDPAFRGVSLYYERPVGEAPPVEAPPEIEEPVPPTEEEDQTQPV